MSGTEENFDTTVDFLVVGSGGGGMAAAITAADRGIDTLVIDKGATFGGSTAISGGGIWIPNAPTLREKGVVDSRESIRRYLDIITEGTVPADRLDAFVDKGPELMDLLDRSPHMKLYWVKGYSDYHPEYDGGRPLGRTIECKPFDTRALKEDEQYQRPNSMKGPLGLWVTSKDYHDLAMVKRTWKGRKASLVAAWRVASNVDGIVAGQKLGAAVDLMDDAWWMPSVFHPMGAVIPLVSERCIPPSVIVNGRGERFTNESSPYVNFVHDQLDGGHVPAWFVMDGKAKSRYPFAQVLPGVPFPQGFYDSGVVHKADTLRDLADAIGVKADTLVATIDRFNGFARTGKDEDFGRGDSAYDRYYGDPTMKNPCLDEIVEGPFYAIRCEAGDLGTKGGLVTDADARVLREDGSVIDGLYATGNTSASVMGNEYAGAGATIGPAMVFGYIAALHVADVSGKASPDTRQHSRAGEVA
ncbi:MAG: FAD-binding protein [Rhodococcus sp. (in: high G+C Gram-positive bacteria)]|nr:MAG: FAD-binding protein [Rhodococcus sp. (in: high G+C Gram-positive bacteria)]